MVRSIKPKEKSKNYSSIAGPGSGKGWRKGDSKYDWATKFRQKSFELTRGKDYHVQTHGLVTTIRQMAAKLNKGVTIRIKESKKSTTIHVTVLAKPVRQQKADARSIYA